MKITADNYSTRSPRVHFATFTCEDSGKTTPLYLHTHAEIDVEIDGLLCRDSDKKEIAKLESRRSRFHAMLRADG